MASRLDRLIHELGEIRRLLQGERRSLRGVVSHLKQERRRLQTEKDALLRYIHELESFMSIEDKVKFKELLKRKSL